ncbi:MarR family transcriptional regulator [Clostridium oryzae]|uniref:Putative HTH-type transcriptional regulator YusO n=1 Tax=Clostridium oryzae TaxID=1450648 RepID=A0A1V4IIN8_9CLOT|nr:MarR family transcriptional regulator [Clostridium oryzae]OPJ59704.1 putative HTH-type transcriptional regulator YusO [Clostridium oryzae]
MIPNGQFDFETIIFSYIDQLKFLFLPNKWNETFFDYSKNELLSLLFIYRNKNVNMSDIAQYISAPLNTVTGVITRLEKKHMVERRRGNEDRRVVYIVLTNEGEQIINQAKKSIEYYVKEVYAALTEEELGTAMNIVNKVITVLKSSSNSENQNEIKRVRRINIE